MHRLVQRLAGSLLLLLGVSALVFILSRLAPGDPARILLGIGASDEAVEQKRGELGLNGSLLEQYLHYLGGVFHGDLGVSYASREPVTSLIAERLPATLWLLVAALAFSVVISLPLSVWAAENRGRWVDSAVRGATVVAVALPAFWTGILLVLLVALPTGIFPVGGFGVSTADHLRSIVLPGLTLAIAPAAVQVRALRTGLAEALDSAYVEAAESRGATRRSVLWRHSVPNAAAPAISLVAVQTGSLLFGAVIVEHTFQLPGLGSGMVLAVSQRDYPMVTGLTLVFGVLVVLISMLGDVLSAAIDPRMRVS